MVEKFLADSMLARLARWLRLLGYDTLYDNNWPDWKLIKIAKEENRVLLTMDKALYRKGKKIGIKCFYVEGEDFKTKLINVILEFKLEYTFNPNASRCPKCNAPVLRINENSWRCSKCSQEYWMGRHWNTINKTLSEIRKVVEGGRYVND